MLIYFRGITILKEYYHKAKILAQKLKQAKKVAIIGHPSPDPDIIGSMFALARGLKSRDLPQPALYLLDPFDLMDLFEEDSLPVVGKPDPSPVDILFILDIGSYKRALENGEIVTNAKFVVNIDHHLDNDGFGDIALVDYDASSTGELVYMLLKGLGVELDKQIARSLYIAIMTDTGGFKYPNTKSRTAAILSELLKFDFNFTEIYREFYDLQSFAQLKLRSRIIDRIESKFDGLVAESFFEEKDLSDLKLRECEAGNLIYDLTNIRGVSLAILYRKLNNEKVKVSFRANKNFDVKSLANILGGGGHKKASGATFKGNFYLARDMVDNYIKKNLSTLVS
ncbi:bifunctional oligoribonuclease/PAP phosphatase NrnA [Candidatus Riflebacteria bacterium]